MQTLQSNTKYLHLNCNIFTDLYHPLATIDHVSKDYNKFTLFTKPKTSLVTTVALNTSGTQKDKIIPETFLAPNICLNRYRVESRDSQNLVKLESLETNTPHTTARRIFTKDSTTDQIETDIGKCQE